MSVRSPFSYWESRTLKCIGKDPYYHIVLVSLAPQGLPAAETGACVFFLQSTPALRALVVHPEHAAHSLGLRKQSLVFWVTVHFQFSPPPLSGSHCLPGAVGFLPLAQIFLYAPTKLLQARHSKLRG